MKWGYLKNLADGEYMANMDSRVHVCILYDKSTNLVIK